MEISVISEKISSIAYSVQASAFSDFFVNRSENVQPPQSPLPFHISAASPPPTRTLTKRRPRRIRRVKRRILFGDDGREENGSFVFGDGWNYNDGDGFFGSGGGGKGWNFGDQGGRDWEDSSDNSVYDPAFDFVFEILCWIAMSNCLHFAFKKVLRFIADGFGDREKVRMRLSPVC